MSRDATPEQIKKAYKRLALNHHPDRIKGDEKAKAEANERFAQIAHAYEMLTRGPDESVQRQHGQYQPDAADMAAGFGGFGGGGGFPQYQHQQPFVSPFMGMMGGFGAGSAFGSFGGMGDPFGSIFGRMPGGAFGGMGENTFNFTDPFDLFRQVFGSDASFDSLGGPMNTVGGGPSGPYLAGNGIFPSFMGGTMPMMNTTSSMQGGGNFTSFTYSSSASTGGVAGSGGTMQSISTTTTIDNGKAVTRTERTTISPDGTRQMVVHLTGDEMTSTGADEQSVPRRLTMGQKRGKRKSRSPTTTIARQQTAPRPNNQAHQYHAHKRKFGDVTRCLKCWFPTIRKRRRLDPGSPAGPG